MKLSKELKAGLIAIFAIVSFVTLFQFMKGRSLFTTDNVFYSKYDNVAGLAISNPVSINGLKVGQVEAISPIKSEDGRIHFIVKVTVDDNFQFSKNSTMEIFEPGFLSGKEMKINLSYDGEIAKDGDTLRGTYQLSPVAALATQIIPLKDQIGSVLTKLDTTLVSANKILDDHNREEVRKLLINVNQTISSFKTTADQANRILATNEKGLNSVINNANKTLNTANGAVEKYGALADKIDIDKLNTTIDEFTKTANNLNKVISGIQNGEGSLGKLTKDDELYNNLTKTSENLNKLIEDLKTNPKRYLNFSVFGKNN